MLCSTSVVVFCIALCGCLGVAEPSLDPPTDLDVDVQSNHRVKLSWTDDTEPSEGRSYTIEYVQVYPENSQQSGNFIRISNDVVGRHMQEIKNLRPFTRYQFRIRLNGLGGIGPYSEPVFAATSVIGGRDAPNTIPHIIRVEQTDSDDSVNVVFSIPRSRHFPHTGILVYYSDDLTTDRLSWPIVRIDNDNDQSVTVTGLTPGRKYAFVAQPFNIRGSGRFSNVVYFETPEKPQEKPGTCPATQGGSFGVCAELCGNDQDCPNSQKCCSNGCGRACSAPAEKPGTCPAPTGDSFGVCAELCSNDHDCPNSQKCCSNGCGRACSAPAEKPGTCPAPTGDSFGVCAELCGNDHECPDSQKCCSNGCGRACSAPAEKPGTCPATQGGSFGVCAELCGNDHDCPDIQKCCSNGCGRACSAPSEKPGTCPAPQGDSFGVCAELCSNDHECPDNQKCCSNGCGRACSAPAPVEKPGTCPAPEGDSFGVCAELCSNDQECPDSQKCCSNGCGRACSAPAPVEKPGTCPAAEGGSFGVCAELCNNDQECPDNQKCCSNGCGRACSAPAPAPKAQPLKQVMKHGTCPVMDSIRGCEDQCRRVSDCPGRQLCCYNGCGRYCVDPLSSPEPLKLIKEPVASEKPGQCPVVPAGYGGICVEDCSKDGDCRDDLKCCSNGCGHVCTPIAVLEPKQADDIYAGCYVLPNPALSPRISHYKPIHGKVVVKQSEAGGDVDIDLELHGFDPNSTHGFHIHTYGYIDSRKGCSSAGGHYNPYNKYHGGPSDEERHVGDLGNIVSDENGRVITNIQDSVASLVGSDTIIGRSFVIHAGVDDLGRGGDEGSRATGNAGARLACCTIGFLPKPEE